MQLSSAMQHIQLDELEAVRGGEGEGAEFASSANGGINTDRNGYATTRGIQGHPLEQNRPDYSTVRGNNDPRGQWI